MCIFVIDMLNDILNTFFKSIKIYEMLETVILVDFSIFW